MINPYADRPEHAFWSRAVASLPAEEVDPVTEVPFRITRADRVATAGSCFAQHISRALVARGFRFLVTEPEPTGGGEGYGVFPARFGNLYTVRQLKQLFDRAYGLFEPRDGVWTRADGALIDPFRPRIQAQGFASIEDLLDDRSRHLAAVRDMFEGCDVLVFTLGLTEAWRSQLDGALVPFAPGAVGAEPGEGGYEFVNFPVDAMAADLTGFITDLRTVNPAVRVVLTVSPVPLVVTYEDRHVAVATAYSKAALRVAADMAARALADVAYFPSFEIITSGYSRGRYLEPDARQVTAEGVEHVMGLFARHFLTDAAAPARPAQATAEPRATDTDDEDQARFDDLAGVICDEEILDI